MDCIEEIIDNTTTIDCKTGTQIKQPVFPEIIGNKDPNMVLRISQETNSEESSKNMLQISNNDTFSIDKLQTLTNSFQQQLNSKKDEHFKRAYQLFKEEVLKNHQKAMMESASKGWSSAILFEWVYVRDKNSPEAKHSKFNGVWTLDILRKSNTLNELEEFFNDNYGTETKRFTVKYFKLRNPDESNMNKWMISVSWRNKHNGLIYAKALKLNT